MQEDPVCQLKRYTAIVINVVAESVVMNDIVEHVIIVFGGETIMWQTDIRKRPSIAIGATSHMLQRSITKITN